MEVGKIYIFELLDNNYYKTIKKKATIKHEFKTKKWVYEQ